MKLSKSIRNRCSLAVLVLVSLAPAGRIHGQQSSQQYWLQGYEAKPLEHGFLDRTNLRLQSVNLVSQTFALLAIQSHDNGGAMGRCSNPPCLGGLAARGRTLDLLEKHFESYGYGWGAVYRYGGGVGLNTFVAFMFHETGHHKLERWVPVIAIGHAQASTGYALTGSSQGISGFPSTQGH